MSAAGHPCSFDLLIHPPPLNYFHSDLPSNFGHKREKRVEKVCSPPSPPILVSACPLTCDVPCTSIYMGTFRKQDNCKTASDSMHEQRVTGGYNLYRKQGQTATIVHGALTHQPCPHEGQHGFSTIKSSFQLQEIFLDRQMSPAKNCRTATTTRHTGTAHVAQHAPDRIFKGFVTFRLLPAAVVAIYQLANLTVGERFLTCRETQKKGRG